MEELRKGRTLIYTVCDDNYSIFIPLFILGHMMHNDNVDVEIGVNADRLDSNTEKILGILRKEYVGKGEIRIDYSVFRKQGSMAVYKDKPMWVNTVRFIAEPQIHDEYTYISDIDICCLEPLVQCHLDDMEKHESNYSNIIRKNSVHLSGLHFTKTDAYWPIEDLNKFDTRKCDEILLYDIVKSKGEKMDTARDYRPMHGIHFSPNRPYVGGTPTIPGWGAEHWKEKWKEFTDSEIYKEIYPYFNDRLKGYIKKLEDFYSGKGK